MTNRIPPIKIMVVGLPSRGAGRHGKGKNPVSAYRLGSRRLDSGLTADPKARLVAVGDAFADQAERSIGLLKQHFGDRIAIDGEHRFAGFDAYPYPG